MAADKIQVLFTPYTSIKEYEYLKFKVRVQEKRKKYPPAKPLAI